MTGPAAYPERDDHQVRAMVRRFRADCELARTPCWLCGQPIDYTLRQRRGHPIPDGAFEADHYRGWAKYPAGRLDPANLRASHHACNRARSDKEPDQARAVLALGEPSREW